MVADARRSPAAAVVVGAIPNAADPLDHDAERPPALATQPDGSVLVAERGARQVRRIAPDE